MKPIAVFRQACLFVSLFISLHSYGVVTVTPAPNGQCLNTSPGAFIAIGDIIITENSNNDFAVQTNTTLILSAPAGFQFNAGVGSVSYINGRNITAASIVVTATTITVTLSVNNTNRSDALTISDIQARATTSGVSGNIVRTGGTASISGNNTGAGVNHGTLSNIKPLRTSATAGNWNSAATWSGGIIPGTCDSVVINHTVTANVTATVYSITINSAGNLVANNEITITNSFTINGTGTYTHANGANPATTIFAGTESFSTTSNLIMNQWHDGNVPLAQHVNGNFGNITFNAGIYVPTWQQNGLFAPHRIKGNITISSGRVILDNGTGMTTAITLQDVLVNGTGRIFYATGANRNLNLTTNNYTDISTSIFLSAIMYLTYGTLNWQCNGSFTVSHDFSATQGTGSQSAAAIVNITNDLNINGGLFDFNYLINGSLDLTVGGNTNINCNSSAWSHFIESNSQALNYTTTNLYLTGSCTNNYIQGSTGATTINILNDFISSGTDNFQMTRRTANSSNFTVNIGRDMIINSGTIAVAVSNQTINCTVNRNLIVNNGNFSVHGYNSATNNMTLTVNNNFEINAGTVTINAGRGNTTLTTIGNFTMSGGIFLGSSNGTLGNWGTASFSFFNFDFTGGVCYLYNNKITDGRTVTVNIINNATIHLPTTSDLVIFVRAVTPINPQLDVTVGNNFTLSGHANAYFLSNAGSGNEYITINGNVVINSARAYFVGNDQGTGSPHNISLQVNGNIEMNGGQLFLSSLDGTATISVNGNVNMTNGTLNVKWDTGIANMTVNGNYNQTGGVFNLHSRNAASSQVVTLNVFGSFNQTGGQFNFDQRAGNDVASNVLNLYGPSVVFGGTGIISHPNHLTSNTVFGTINYIRNGTISFNRSSNTHDIRHVKQEIASECLLNASSSTNNLQIASHSSSTFATHNSMTINGTLDLGENEIFARQQTDYYSAVTLNSTGLLRIAHTGGLYSGSSASSAINSMISGNNRMDYYLHPQSTVEYNGTSNQIITGIPNGIANSNNHKYGTLLINFQGTPDVNFVYPETTGEVYIRTGLVLENGELNLDNDHDPVSGGRRITIENGATVARTNGYIRSEVYDGSAEVLWNITGLGSFTFPFGFNSSEYIPFEITTTSGVANDVRIATYNTNAMNIPYPPGVNHVNDLSGNNNSANTADRFWKIMISGTPTVDFLFTATSAEVGSISNLTAQRWLPANNGWEPPQGTQSNPTAYSTLASGITGLGTWWTLASGTSPLPVELVSFNASCIGKNVILKWATESEINNAGFEIQKSVNQQDFIPVGFIHGHGTTSHFNEYAFLDSAVSDKAFYRLKQVDYNGSSSFSDVILSPACQLQPFIEINSISAQSGSLQAFIHSTDHAEVSIRLFDVIGKLIRELNTQLVPGMNQINIGKDSGLAVYLISVSEKHNQFSMNAYKVPNKN